MLARRYRLSRADFAHLMKYGRRIRTPELTLVHLAQPDALRCGVAVSKKVAKRAVDRHVLRRAVYSVFDRVHAELPPCLVAVVAQRPLAKCSRAEVRARVREALVRAGLVDGA